MELTHPTTRKLSRRIDLGLALTTVVALAIISSIGFYLALRSGTIPSFDKHLTLDGRQALVVQNDLPYELPCVPAEPPQEECGEDGGRHEFKVIYSTPEKDWVLIDLALPNL